ncbi:hypothetical protein JANLI_26930 [Janthinobacterium lividum]|nr:hypothetical protein JANLI_26930 [Janthinobacterium lividum]
MPSQSRPSAPAVETAAGAATATSATSATTTATSATTAATGAGASMPLPSMAFVRICSSSSGMAGKLSGAAPFASSVSWSATKPDACSAASMAMGVTGAAPVRKASNRFSVRWQAATSAGKPMKPAPPLMVWKERNTAFSVSLLSGSRSRRNKCSSTLTARSIASTTKSLSISSIRIPNPQEGRLHYPGPAPPTARTGPASAAPAFAPAFRAPRPARCRAAAEPARAPPSW